MTILTNAILTIWVIPIVVGAVVVLLCVVFFFLHVMSDVAVVVGGVVLCVRLFKVREFGGVACLPAFWFLMAPNISQVSNEEE